MSRLSDLYKALETLRNLLTHSSIMDKKKCWIESTRRSIWDGRWRLSNERWEWTIKTSNPITENTKKADPQADTGAWETEIDRLVYELYGLSEEEIKVVEGKQKRKKRY